jgi:hypothetical protein
MRKTGTRPTATGPAKRRTESELIFLWNALTNGHDIEAVECRTAKIICGPRQQHSQRTLPCVRPLVQKSVGSRISLQIPPRASAK